LSFFLGALLLVAPLRGEFNNPINKTILEAISSMPHGGGYSTSNLAMKRLQHAVTVSDGKLVVRPTLAQPSFCSEATYLLFLKTLLLLQEQHQLTLDTAPGVACLFHDLKIGKNFTSLEQAEPGDFLKIFWTSSVGAIEHGHLVVYLGHEMRNGVEMIHFWSSNQHVGYGDKWVPLRAMRHLLFSRLTNPAVLTSWHQLPRSDIYLASLLSKTSSWEEVKQRCEIVEDRR